MSTVKIGGRVISDAEPTFIIFEAGPTHTGVESAKRLIKEAATAGADAIKFQILDPDRLIFDKTQTFTYKVLTDKKTRVIEDVTEPLYNILARRALTHEEWRSVKNYADQQGLLFFATVGFSEEVDLLESMGCHSIKIASADVNHFPLIKKAAKTGLCIQLDTGKASLGEIEQAVNLIRAEGNENIIIHHCPSGYPAHTESINLSIITTLKKMFPYPIAFSDHTPGFVMDIAAVALGVNLLEKTITENRLIRSVEHIMSLEPSEMQHFVETIREVQKAMGKSYKVLSTQEINDRNSIRRSVYFTSAVTKGKLLGECPVEFRRPGFGISPDKYELLVGARLARDILAGEQLSLKDLTWV